MRSSGKGKMAPCGEGSKHAFSSFNRVPRRNFFLIVGNSRKKPWEFSELRQQAERRTHSHKFSGILGYFFFQKLVGILTVGAWPPSQGPGRESRCNRLWSRPILLQPGRSSGPSAADLPRVPAPFQCGGPRLLGWQWGRQGCRQAPTIIPKAESLQVIWGGGLGLKTGIPLVSCVSSVATSITP